MNDDLTWEQELILTKWGKDITLPEIIEEQDRRLDRWAEIVEDRDRRLRIMTQERDRVNDLLAKTERLLADLVRDLPEGDLVALLRGDERDA